MAYPTPFIKYVSPGFSAEKTRSFELRMQLSSQELILTLYNPLTDQFELIERYAVANAYNKIKPHEAMARILQTHALTRLPFKQVEILLVTPVWSLIPTELYDESSLREILQLGHELNEDDPIRADKLDVGGLIIGFSWPKEWQELIDNQFPDALVRHSTAVLAGQMMRSGNKKTGLFAHVHGFQMDVLALEEGKPVLFNSFEFQSPEDFLYYLSFAYEELKFDRESTPLYLLGEIEEGSAIHQLCFKYIRNISFLERQSNSSVPEPEGDIPPLSNHALVNLLHPYDSNN